MSDPIVTKNQDASRWEAHVDGELAGFAEIQESEGQVVFTHTEVDDRFEGRGVGSALARTGLDGAREAGQTVVPQCSFIAGWIDKHPDYQDLVAS